MRSAAMALASSPAAAPPIPSATMKSDPRGPTSWLRTSGWRLAFPVLRSATRKVSSLCSRLRPRSVLPNTLTRTGPWLTRSSNRWHTTNDRLRWGDRRPLGESHEVPSAGYGGSRSDESRKQGRERQRRLGVSDSRRLPCSHVRLSSAGHCGALAPDAGVGVLPPAASPHRSIKRHRADPFRATCLVARRRSCGAAGGLPRTERRGASSGLILSLRLGRTRPHPADDQRKSGPGLAQRRLAGVDPVSGRDVDDVPDRGSHRKRYLCSPLPGAAGSRLLAPNIHGRSRLGRLG